MNELGQLTVFRRSTRPATSSCPSADSSFTPCLRLLKCEWRDDSQKGGRKQGQNGRKRRGEENGKLEEKWKGGEKSREGEAERDSGELP